MRSANLLKENVNENNKKIRAFESKFEILDTGILTMEEVVDHKLN